MDLQSILGYSKGSPFANNPYLDINTPDGLIDMSNTDIDLWGIDNKGNKKKMKAGRKKPYQFPGDKVREIPVAQQGKLVNPFGDPRDLVTRNSSESTQAPVIPKQEELAQQQLKRIQDQAVYLNQAKVPTAAQRATSIAKNKAYAAANPYSTVNEQGDLVPKQYNRSVAGTPDYGSRAKANDKAIAHIEGALDAASLVMPGTSLIGKGLKNAGKYLTEKTALKNAYKLNPLAFKPNPESYYRMIGKEGYTDALESGIIRANPNNIHPWDGTQIYNEPYFSKGVPLDRNWKSPLSKKIGSIYKGPNMVEVNDASKFKASDSFVSSPNSELSSFDPSVKLYKEDWLKGYKEIPKNKPGEVYWNGRNYQNTPTSSQEILSSKSEIDWGKWNSEIPSNKALMSEYSNIERTSKAKGTWMKNPDGSAFQGTPEQFVQQNSKNFKKAFGNSKLINPDGSPTIQYHGSAKKFDTFDESKFQLGDSGYSGVGIYTTPSKSTAQSYAISSSKFHSGKIEPTVYELYGQANNPISSSQLIKENKGRDLFNFHRKNNWKGELTPEESLMEFDAAVADQLPNVERIRPWNDAREIVFPSNKQLKSAIGNNGMFDMTNPNIYKSLVPAIVGVGLSQKKQTGGPTKEDIYKFLFDDEPTAPDTTEVPPQPEQEQDETDLPIIIANQDGFFKNNPYINNPRMDRFSTSPEGEDNGMWAYNYLVQEKGLAPHVAAGIVGNFDQESGRFRDDVIAGTKKGDNGLATGIAQWHPDRWKKAEQWANSTGNNIRTLKGQLDWAIHEASQRGDLQKVSKARDTEEAAYLFAKHYERPKIIDKNRARFAKRYNPYKQGGIYQEIFKTNE